MWFIVEWSKKLMRHRVILCSDYADKEAVVKAHAHDTVTIEGVIALEDVSPITTRALTALDMMCGGAVKFFIESLALQFYEAGRKAEREKEASKYCPF
jgi:hypothetical protein